MFYKTAKKSICTARRLCHVVCVTFLSALWTQTNQAVCDYRIDLTFTLQILEIKIFIKIYFFAYKCLELFYESPWPSKDLRFHLPLWRRSIPSCIGVWAARNLNVFWLRACSAFIDENITNSVWVLNQWMKWSHSSSIWEAEPRLFERDVFGLCE